MNATEDLRRMLDERGVEHDDAYDITLWTGADGRAYTAVEMVPLSKKPSEKLMVRQVLTPKQAIAATLGPGECHNTEEYPFMWSFTCSECGVHSMTEGCGFNFCPNCGRKVVDE